MFCVQNHCISSIHFRAVIKKECVTMKGKDFLKREVKGDNQEELEYQ